MILPPKIEPKKNETWWVKKRKKTSAHLDCIQSLPGRLGINSTRRGKREKYRRGSFCLFGGYFTATWQCWHHSGLREGKIERPEHTKSRSWSSALVFVGSFYVAVCTWGIALSDERRAGKVAQSVVEGFVPIPLSQAAYHPLRVLRRSSSKQ